VSRDQITEKASFPSFSFSIFSSFFSHLLSTNDALQQIGINNWPRKYFIQKKWQIQSQTFDLQKNVSIAKGI
jgi:hypothetical protein